MRGSEGFTLEKFVDTVSEKPVMGVLVLIFMALFLAVFQVIYKKALKKSSSLDSRFVWQMIRLVVIAACVFSLIGLYVPDLNLNRVLLSGSALMVAIIGFAAQTAISDLICGLLISINKPFEIGNRIIVEGQEPGIVEDITLRHTVVRLYDGIRIVVPNSQLNTKVITNTSYKSERRGIHLKYTVSYDTDVQKAMDIIRDCVAESPYTLSVENNGITEDSGPVYFLQFGDSALVLETTIFVLPSTSTYIATTDLNLRVNNAFKANGIEIPYPYFNIIEKEESLLEGDDHDMENELKHTPRSNRHYRTDTIRIQGDESIEAAINVAKHFATRQKLGKQDSMQLQLLSEESIGLMREIFEGAKASFWVEGSGTVYRIHLHLPVSVGSEEYKRLMSLSSTGKNAAKRGLGEKIWELIRRAFNSETNTVWSLREQERENPGDGLSESMLEAFADDIKVMVTKTNVDLVVEKNPGV